VKAPDATTSAIRRSASCWWGEPRPLVDEESDADADGDPDDENGSLGRHVIVQTRVGKPEDDLLREQADRDGGEVAPPVAARHQ
jgi:hypothetical protein